jgi:hypothetical protein
MTFPPAPQPRRNYDHKELALPKPDIGFEHIERSWLENVQQNSERNYQYTIRRNKQYQMTNAEFGVFSRSDGWRVL